MTDEFHIRRGGACGSGRQVSGGFVVHRESRASKKISSTVDRHVVRLRAILLREGVLVDEGEMYRFIQEYTFTSPSTAAGVLLGRTVNGRTEWKTLDGRTLKEVQRMSRE